MNLATLQRVVLEVAAAREPEQVFETIVRGLSAEPAVALARIWLMDEGDLCDSCTFQAECADRSRCLHLVASAGTSAIDDEVHWNRIDGSFRRFPLGVRKVGAIGASGEALLLRVNEEGDAGHNWLARPEWAEAEGIECFAGQPLLFRGEIVGVLAVFSRTCVDPEVFAWLRTFADHAAVAIANARAFAEIDELRRQLELERDYLREEISVVRGDCGIVGESPALRQVLEQIEVVAPTEATVLIEGESGTGKELIASALHERGPRAGQALVRVNCASVPHELFESEFFGHLKGAFTGALRDRAGRFQVAHGGTLFLDEVGEIPLDLQSKLLRALQEGRFARVGEDVEHEVDVRVVAATNRDLAQEVAQGRFREDLYYRLSVFPIRVPPLRERKSDIPLLAQRFIEKGYVGPTDKRPRLSRAMLDGLLAYDWPGNVRELQNVIERALIRSRGGRLSIDLPGSVPKAKKTEGATERRLMTYQELRELERRNVLSVLEEVGWKISGPGGAAELLGINAATLNSRLRAMDIVRPGKKKS